MTIVLRVNKHLSRIYVLIVVIRVDRVLHVLEHCVFRVIISYVSFGFEHSVP